HGHARRGLSCAGPLQDVSRIPEIVFDCSREVGVAGPRPRDGLLFVFGAVDVLDRQGLCPVLPVAVADEDSDWRPDGPGVAHSGHDLRLVRLNLHAAAPPVALLAPPQLAVYGFN